VSLVDISHLGEHGEKNRIMQVGNLVILGKSYQLLSVKVFKEKTSEHFVSEYHMPDKTKLLVYFYPLKIQ